MSGPDNNGCDYIEPDPMVSSSRGDLSESENESVIAEKGEFAFSRSISSILFVIKHSVITDFNCIWDNT